MLDRDWHRVVDAQDILKMGIVFSFNGNRLIAIQDSNLIRQYFSAEQQPTLWHAFLALKELQSAWEKKQDAPRFDLYKDALASSLKKLWKYYSQLDEKLSFVLALVEYDPTVV